ncbi:DUF58 domain-containing protein [Agrococcus terreus]|uniref:DUF58 domain-containing protein n=1 Tax=Agrococcus terreus TaxID=574649 RepID=A0ABQ2KP17_9MICO|nr:DUF58 domain-containing protein [Agrococcus terreus]GGN87111.1 hypothetical protein GCM10010968_21310 [Agrococcus terreus]
MALRERPRARPTGRGVALVIAGLALVLAAYWERQAMLLVPAALCLGVVALGAWWALEPAGRVRLRLPGVVEEGDDPAIAIAGDRRHARARWTTYAPGSGRSVLLEGELDDDGRAEVRLGPHDRGRWPLAPVEVIALDPFRVVRTVRRVEPGAALVVGPETVPMQPSALRSDRDSGREARSRTADSVDAMVREWQPGDPQRRVHWRQSAKRGRLMVRQESNPAVDDHVVLVATAAARGLGKEAEDRLARAACSIAMALAGGDHGVLVRETGEQSIGVHAPGPIDWRRREQALAAFASLAALPARAPDERDRDRALPAHVVALQESAPEHWTLPPGSTLWLVAERPGTGRAVAAGSRVRVRRWIDRAGPSLELA